MHVYTEGPSLEALARSVGFLEREAESNADLAEHVEVVTDALKRSLPAMPKVIWQGDVSGRARYRVVAHVRPGQSEPAGFSIERGHRDAMGGWSWNRCGGTPRFVFRQLLKDYCKLLDAAPEVTP